MPWDEKTFQARIKRRAAVIGLTVREVMRKAGVSEDTFTKLPGPQGRTYNLIEAIARAVGWSVAEAICEAGWRDEDERLRFAVHEAHRVIAEAIKRAPEAAASGLSPDVEAMLVGQSLRGLPLSESTIELTIRLLWLTSGQEEEAKEAQRWLDEEQKRLKEEAAAIDRRAEELERLAAEAIRISKAETPVEQGDAHPESAV